MMIQRFKRSKLRSALFLVLSTCLMLVSGCLTLLWHVQQRQISHADGGNVLGPPSLPAATVDAIFRRVGSPMAGTGKVVEEASRQANIDDAFALGVWWAETNDGMAGVGRGDRNPGSVRGSPGYPVAFDSYTLYPSYSAAIVDWFKLLRSRYVDRGLTSVYTICYPYVGTSSSALWAAKVVSYMYRYRGEAPPLPTVAPPHQIRSHPPFSVSAKNRQKTLGFAQEQHRPSASIPAVTRRPAAVQQSIVPARPASNQLPLIVFGLLASLAIAFYARKLRRTTAISAPELATGTLAGSLPALYVNQYSPVLPPLYVNEFSPVIEHDTAALFSPEWSQPPVGLEQPLYAVAGASAPPIVPMTPVLPTGDSFAGYHRIEVRPHRIRLRQAEEAPSVTVPQATEDQHFFDNAGQPVAPPPVVVRRGTGALLHPQSVVPSLPGHVDASRGHGGGLLRRYRLEQASENS